MTDTTEELLDAFEATVKDAAYSDCSPMGDPGNYYKHMERDEARAVLLAAVKALQDSGARYGWLRGDGGAHSRRWPRWRVEHWNGVYWNPVSKEEMDVLVDEYRAGEQNE